MPKRLMPHFRVLLLEGSVHPNHYNGNGRNRSRGPDFAVQLYTWLLGPGGLSPHHAELGNDAPRGGHAGWFVKLTPAGRRIRFILDATAQAREEKAAAEALAEETRLAAERRRQAMQEVFDSAGGEDAMIGWFQALPLEKRLKFRGYGEKAEPRNFSKSLRKRIRRAYMAHLTP